MCTSSVSNVIYNKFSYGAAFYTLNGKNVGNVVFVDHLNTDISFFFFFFLLFLSWISCPE